MGYTDSPLVDYIKISPNRTVNRDDEVDTVTIHCVVGQASVESLGAQFANPARKASSNYGIGPDGRIGMYVEEKDRSWCSSSSSNDNRSITIEVASDKTHPYAVTDAAFKSLIRILIDICQRNPKLRGGLRWLGDKSLIGQVDKQNMTVHRWFANKSCPGDYLYNRHGEIAAEVNKALKGEVESMTKEELKVFIEETVRNMGKNAPASSWAVESVAKVKDMGISDGSNPQSYATREQVMSMIVRSKEI